MTGSFNRLNNTAIITILLLTDGALLELAITPGVIVDIIRDVCDFLDVDVIET